MEHLLKDPPSKGDSTFDLSITSSVVPVWPLQYNFTSESGQALCIAVKLHQH